MDEEVFADEMRALHAAGYTAVTLRQAWDGWQHGGPLPRKPVVITFDDGYLSHYTHAKPVLRELGWPGVLFLTTKAIGPGGLTEHQLRSLLKAGWEIDSHTLTHPDLTTLDDTALAHELSESRRELQQRLGVPADFFAYPAGRYDARVVAATEGGRLHGGDHGRAGHRHPARRPVRPPPRAGERVRHGRDAARAAPLTRLRQRGVGARSARSTQPNPPSWGSDRIDQRDLPLNNSFRYANTAFNVTAYIIDTGIRTTHDDFTGRASWGTNTTGDGNDTDCNGHGTHVAGTIGGSNYGVAGDRRLLGTPHGLQPTAAAHERPAFTAGRSSSFYGW